MLRFAQTCVAVAATTKKTEKIRLVRSLLQSLPIEDATRAAIFPTGRPFPRWDERVLGMGGRLLARLIGELSAKSGEAMSGVYRKHGDLGDMAEEILAERSGAPGVSLGEAALVFGELAAARGQSEKTDLLRRLLARARPAEVKYIVKIMTGDLRIGLRENLVEEAITKAYERPIGSVRRANMLLGDIGETLQCAFRDELETVRFRLFHPIDFMLATPVEAAAEIFKSAAESMVLEEKYDGIRAQAHKSGTRVKIFSRTLDEVVEFPELREPLAALSGEYIVDGEILAWHEAQPLPFTQLQKRLGRRNPDLWLIAEIPVQFVLFDLLYQDGDLLLDEPLVERRRRLKQLLAAQTKQLQLAPERMCKTREALEEAFRAALAVYAGATGPFLVQAEGAFCDARLGGHGRGIWARQAARRALRLYVCGAPRRPPAQHRQGLFRTHRCRDSRVYGLFSEAHYGRPGFPAHRGADNRAGSSLQQHTALEPARKRLCTSISANSANPSGQDAAAD